MSLYQVNCDECGVLEVKLSEPDAEIYANDHAARHTRHDVEVKEYEPLK